MSALKMMEIMTNPSSQTWTIIAMVNLPPQRNPPPQKKKKALLEADDKQTGSTSLIGGAQPLPTP